MGHWVTTMSLEVEEDQDEEARAQDFLPVEDSQVHLARLALLDPLGHQGHQEYCLTALHQGLHGIIALNGPWYLSGMVTKIQ